MWEAEFVWLFWEIRTIETLTQVLQEAPWGGKEGREGVPHSEASQHLHRCSGSRTSPLTGYLVFVTAAGA